MPDSGEAKGEQLTSSIPVAIISGPTCSGKSTLAIEMARLFGGEIISADSRQIYRQLKIGTDRLEESQWQGIRHHLTGMVDLGERFTVFDFVRRAQEIIHELHASGKKIIICGGTGLYIRALIDGIYELPDRDLGFRDELLDLAASQGTQNVYSMLQRADPEAASEIHPNNLVRIIRALEINRLTGMSRSQLKSLPDTRDTRFRYLQITLLPDRLELYRRIEERVERMVAEGLVGEARALYDSPFREALRASRVVGYSELIRHFENDLTVTETIGLIKQNTRRFAKRQYTWFRAINDAQVLEIFGERAADSCKRLLHFFW
jgi:tRNA dimethylallyltransferase